MSGIAEAPKQPIDPAAARGAAWRLAVVVLAAGCVVLLLNYGLRQSFGVFLQPISATYGWGREVFALTIALQNLMWGISQPLAGAIADRFGTGRVVAAGGCLYVAGLWFAGQAETVLGFNLTAGLLVGAGMGGTGFAVVLAAMARAVPPERRGVALGLGTAAGSFGQFLLVPAGQAFIDGYGWPMALMLLAGCCAAMLPLSGLLAGKAESSGPQQSLREALREAFGHGGFWLLTTGYFVCGFQLSFMSNHMPAYLFDRGVDTTLAAWAVGVIGLFNVCGALMAGMLSGRMRKKYLLCAIYLGRGAIIVLFMLMPLSTFSIFLFSVVMGLLWLSTVPVTTALVAQIFGIRYLATLSGVVFFSHQLGSSLGVWAGGFLYDRTGSYDVVWWFMVVLSLLAALVNFPIDDRTVLRKPVPA